jgi:hypothetical protein
MDPLTLHMNDVSQKKKDLLNKFYKYSVGLAHKLEGHNIIATWEDYLSVSRLKLLSLPLNKPDGFYKTAIKHAMLDYKKVYVTRPKRLERRLRDMCNEEEERDRTERSFIDKIYRKDQV